MRSNGLSMSPICLYDISCKQMSEAECCFQNESDTTQSRVYRILPKTFFLMLSLDIYEFNIIFPWSLLLSDPSFKSEALQAKQEKVTELFESSTCNI